MTDSVHEGGDGPDARGGRADGPPSARRRDRDGQGRARNARPRDGLGRPLPYGAPGVTRQEEGVVRSAQETLAEAQRLLDAGRPFHAHEVFEDRWKSAPEPERELWRGLAQFAVGLTHAARGNTTGSRALLSRAAAALAPFAQTPPYGIDVSVLAEWAAERAARPDGPAARAVPRLRGGATAL
ncbi:DUF309 domain-containing protein [Kitasatospora sp. NBC_00315]|uniref:DUF309 domain-containing protein n=1 Tax=Kitasatospora sp. NBC_00315 TaxID=2975963 RepID=UPI003249E488